MSVSPALQVRHEDGSQEGTYGWVDPNGVLRLFDYIADDLGYRIVQVAASHKQIFKTNFSTNPYENFIISSKL